VNGLVTIQWAERVYGVLIDPEDMRLDMDGTERLRRRMMEERLRRAKSSEVALETKSGERIARIGEYMYIIDCLGEKFLQCLCGYNFCSIKNNWKEKAYQIPILPEDIGPRIKVRDELELRGYICPRCAILHSFEVAKKGEPPLWDIELT